MKDKLKEEKINKEAEEEKKTYVPPAVETQHPLEIMSAWQDRSSELQF